MPNPTMAKFGHPHTQIAETSSWSVLLRPGQVTLGSLVLVAKEDAKAFGDLSPAAFADLGNVVRKVEAMLRAFVGFERINYLMLMMVDPDVHFHVIPRYEGARSFEGTEFPDAGWPGQPALNQATEPEPETLARLRDALAAHWERA